MLENANIFVTGGAGTLGRAIAELRFQEGWTGRFTVYSTDEHKHAYMRKLYPDILYVQGDIRSPETLYNAMVGHDVVIHAAAVKVIPTSEWDSIDTFDVNVTGSINVCAAAAQAQIKHLLAISTDKVCHPANAYGCSKLMMEKVVQEYARIVAIDTEFHLVRYGNVLESTGSVIDAWNKALEDGKRIKITDPEMTRFWLSPAQAAKLVVESMALASGNIYIPKMPSLSIGKLASYTVEMGEGYDKIPLRPGEKMHETLVTEEEMSHTYYEENDCFFLTPTTLRLAGKNALVMPYTSENARELTKEELMALLDD